jgi:two-component system OmpR family sensor kinase/two-component system sensor histidine kinase BaeS
MRRTFFRRIAIAAAIFFGFVVVVGWISALLFHDHWRPGGGARPFPGFLFLLVLAFVGFVAFGRALRRTAGPIGDVMEAASKVATGDYSARAPVHGPQEVRELAEAFNEMAAKIEAGERQRRNLVADVTHELRTPLSVIQGRIEGMLDDVYAPDREHLGLVLQQTQVLSRLLDDLSLLSKAEAGALRLDRERIAASTLVDDAVAAHRDEAQGRGITLRARVAEDVPEVNVDRVRIGEVLSNLLTNALRYTPAGGAVTVSADRADDGIAIAVTDTGSGIPAGDVPRVFDRFTKSPDSRGSGLGLAIARSLVEAHGGSISARGDRSGTSIRFVLPAA